MRIYKLCLIIIIKSEVWTITHCLGLGHETMVCAECFSMFLWYLNYVIYFQVTPSHIMSYCKTKQVMISIYSSTNSYDVGKCICHRFRREKQIVQLHYSDVIMGVMVSQITSLLFTLPFIQAQIKEKSKLCVAGLCEGNSTVTGEFTAQRANNAENVSIWWRHHV